MTRSGVAGFRLLNAVCLPSSATKLRPNLTNEVTHTCRLQHLESSHNAISSDVDHIKALGSNIEGWKHQMNDAGAQAAAVLALVQSDGSEIRYQLSCKSTCLWALGTHQGGQHSTCKRIRTNGGPNVVDFAYT